jgi:hypothetical protein
MIPTDIVVLRKKDNSERTVSTLSYAIWYVRDHPDFTWNHIGDAERVEISKPQHPLPAKPDSQK